MSDHFRSIHTDRGFRFWIYIFLSITIFISTIGCGSAFERNFCDRTPFSVECKGEIVCPLDGQYVIVQCEIENITSSDIILQ